MKNYFQKINFSRPVSRIQDPIRLADLWKYDKILGKGVDL
jgi:hypothetical protein